MLVVSAHSIDYVINSNLEIIYKQRRMEDFVGIHYLYRNEKDERALRFNI